MLRDTCGNEGCTSFITNRSYLDVVMIDECQREGCATTSRTKNGLRDSFACTKFGNVEDGL